MGRQLTQWTLVRGRGASAEGDERVGFVRLRSPAGEFLAFPIADLPAWARAELRALASGSKLPAALMQELLHATTPAAPPRGSAPGVGARLKVLLVEDQPDGRAILAEYLTVMGLEVAVAEDGRRGIELARAMRPDVIVMDLAMPVLDGWEATRRLKSDPSTLAIPIVALSAYSDRRAKERALEAGCCEVLVKPIAPAELVSRLRAWVGPAEAEPGITI
jgi:CheY-like chemotaxis protein